MPDRRRYNSSSTSRALLAQSAGRFSSLLGEKRKKTRAQNSDAVRVEQCLFDYVQRFALVRWAYKTGLVAISGVV